MDDYLIETIEQLEALGESLEVLKEFKAFYDAEIEERCKQRGESLDSIGYGIISILEDWSFIKKMQEKASALFKNLEYRRFDDSIEESDDLYCWQDNYGWRLYMNTIPRLLKTRVISTREEFLLMLQETGASEEEFERIYKNIQEKKAKYRYVLGGVDVYVERYDDYAFDVYFQDSRYLIQTSSLPIIFAKEMQ